jgi:hypothetical protein
MREPEIPNFIEIRRVVLEVRDIQIKQEARTTSPLCVHFIRVTQRKHTILRYVLSCSKRLGILIGVNCHIPQANSLILRNN